MRLKSDSLLSKTDLTVGDFVPATSSGINRARSLSEILNDSTDHSSGVLQPIKIHPRDSDDDDDVIDDDVSDDDVISDDVGNAELLDYSDEDVDDRKMNSPPTRPVRPGPPPKPKRSNEHESKSNNPPVKTERPKPARPKPFNKTAVSSPTNKRKTPPNRPGRPPAPAEKTTPPIAHSRNSTPPARQRTENEAVNMVTKPSLPQRPVSGAAERNSVDSAAKPFLPEKPERSVLVDHETKPVPSSRLEENMQGQAAGSSKPTAPPRRLSSKVEEGSDHETKPIPPARPRSYAEHINEKSGVHNHANHMAPLRPRSEEKPTDNALSTKSATPPPRPSTPPHRPPPPPAAKAAVSKDKDVQPRSQKAKESNQQVKESEGQSFRQRLGTLSKFTRKQQREEVRFFLKAILIKI